MSTFILYPQDGIKCVICGDDVKSAVMSNTSVIQYYIGASVEILHIDIEDVNEDIADYKVNVKYLKYNSNRKLDKSEEELVLWCKEVDDYKMPWENGI